MGISDSSGTQASQHNSSAPPWKAPFKKGDFIGKKYEVYDVLGTGGFGIVYLVYSNETEKVYALKTFQDEYLEDEQTRNRFRKEAEVWINLERHPYIVRASFVDKLSGRLYIAMEHIAADEQGLNSLDAYLKRRPPDLAQSLKWAIQFCHGMEYAYSKGVKAHRDIKPANIMIDQNKAVKITDFGLAGILSASSVAKQYSVAGIVGSNASMQTAIGTSIGTPEYMSPEQFSDLSACDERSDIYSFGIVLYQMASGGRLPFSTDNPSLRWTALKHSHQETPVPKLKSPLFPLIFRCLEKKPINRYYSCKELRRDLESLLKKYTGEIVKLPELKELEAWELSNKGVSLSNLGKYQEAIACYDKAIEINPGFADAWHNKTNSLEKLGKDQEVIACYDKALEINPGFVEAWVNKGFFLSKLGKYQEAIACYDRALELNPKDTKAWLSKGVSLLALSKYQEAIACFDKALEINPGDADAWLFKGDSLENFGKYQEAIACFGKALEIDSRNARAWYANALVADILGRQVRAFHSFKQFLSLATEQHIEQIEYARQRLKELEEE
jgi:serine/threonine protein kinase